MIRIAPSEKDTTTATLEKRLWSAAEQAVPALLSGLKSQEYSGGRPQGPVLRLEGAIRHDGNTNAVDKERLNNSVGQGRRFPFGLLGTNNANYLCIQLFHSALNDKGHAGFVMANGEWNSHYCSMKIIEQKSSLSVRKGSRQEFVEKRAEVYARV